DEREPQAYVHKLACRAPLLAEAPRASALLGASAFVRAGAEVRPDERASFRDAHPDSASGGGHRGRPYRGELPVLLNARPCRARNQERSVEWRQGPQGLRAPRLVA